MYRTGLDFARSEPARFLSEHGWPPTRSSVVAIIIGSVVGALRAHSSSPISASIHLAPRACLIVFSLSEGECGYEIDRWLRGAAVRVRRPGYSSIAAALPILGGLAASTAIELRRQARALRTSRFGALDASDSPWAHDAPVLDSRLSFDTVILEVELTDAIDSLGAARFESVRRALRDVLREKDASLHELGDPAPFRVPAAPSRARRRAVSLPSKGAAHHAGGDAQDGEPDPS